jgi:hypothetical protein
MGQAPQASRRTIRRQQRREIVPLADSTIYDMEQRGSFRSVSILPRAASSCGLRHDGSAGHQSHQKYHQSPSIRAAASAL